MEVVRRRCKHDNVGEISIGTWSGGSTVGRQREEIYKDRELAQL